MNQQFDTGISPEDCKQKFRIPLYQRPYAWTTEQVMQLLLDLKAAYEKTKPDYYIGILSVAPTATDRSRYDLIDGQQRITTLMLIAKVLKEHYGKWEEFIKDRLDFYGREEDRAFLYDLSPEAALKCNAKLREAVDVISRFINSESDKKAYAEYVYNHTKFFLSEVPPGYSILEKNQQFVRMNNRGKQLEAHQILKVKLLQKIDSEVTRNSKMLEWDEISQLGCKPLDEDKKAELLVEIKDYKLSSILEKDLVKESRAPTESEFFIRPIVDFPTFLLIALKRSNIQVAPRDKDLVPDAHEVRNIISFDKSKLLESFGFGTNEHDWKSEEVISFIGVLNNQYELLKLCFIYRETREGFKLGRSESERPRWDDASEADKRKLKTLQSFLYVSTAAHHWMPYAFDYLSNAPGAKIDEFTKELERIDNDALKRRELTPLPDTLKIESMAYDKHPSHYWFYRLDYELWKLWEKRGEALELAKSPWLNLDDEGAELAKKYIFRKCNSIEHVIPQTEQASGKTNSDHSFGNLALISREMNSKFSNNYEDGKKKFIIKTYAESLKMVHFLWGGGGKNIDETGTQMLSILAKAIKPEKTVSEKEKT